MQCNEVAYNSVDSSVHFVTNRTVTSNVQTRSQTEFQTTNILTMRFRSGTKGRLTLSCGCGRNQ